MKVGDKASAYLADKEEDKQKYNGGGDEGVDRRVDATCHDDGLEFIEYLLGDIGAEHGNKGIAERNEQKGKHDPMTASPNQTENIGISFKEATQKRTKVSWQIL